MNYFQSITIIILFSMIKTLVTNSICSVHGENCEWKIQGTNCGKFCAEVLIPAIKCDPWQFHLGCFCKEGFYLNKNLKCVTAAQCEHGVLEEMRPPPDAPDCPVREGYDNCSSRCLEMCKNRDDPIACPVNCDSGCFCKGAQLRNNNGRCVPIDQCEPLPGDKPKSSCPMGETYMECDNRCHELCPSLTHTFGQAMDCDKCEAGCFCQPGLLRSERGACIEKSNCEQTGTILSHMSSIMNTAYDVENFNEFSAEPTIDDIFVQDHLAK